MNITLAVPATNSSHAWEIAFCGIIIAMVVYVICRIYHKDAS